MGKDGRSFSQDMAAQGWTKLETTAQLTSAATAKKLPYPWVQIHNFLTTGLGNRYSIFLPLFNRCRQNPFGTVPGPKGSPADANCD